MEMAKWAKQRKVIFMAKEIFSNWARPSRRHFSDVNMATKILCLIEKLGVVRAVSKILKMTSLHTRY